MDWDTFTAGLKKTWDGIKGAGETVIDVFKTQVSGVIGATKTIGSNGNIGIGFQGATNGSGFSAFNAYKNKTVDGYTKAGYSDNFAWCVPVMFNLSF